MGNRRNSFDYHRIRTDFLQSIRGEKTYGAINTQLGITGNLFYKWEKGLKIFQWLDFINVCTKASISIGDVLAKVFCYYGEVTSVIEFMNHLTNGRSPNAIGDDLGFKPYTVQRWQDGITKPSFEEVIRVIDHYTRALPTFISLIEKDGCVSPLLAEAENSSRIRHFVSRYPEMLRMLHALELEVYESLEDHNVAVLTQVLDLSAAQIETSLKLLRENGLVEMKNRKYVPCVEAMTWNGDLESSRAMFAHLMKKALQKTRNTQDAHDLISSNDCFSHRTFVASRKAADEIKKEFLNFYRKVDSIIKDDAGPNELLKAFVFQFS
ncbi:MAG: DUF4423 domain-containing protein [Oligoflexales bacterium]